MALEYQGKVSSFTKRSKVFIPYVRLFSTITDKLWFQATKLRQQVYGDHPVTAKSYDLFTAICGEVGKYQYSGEIPLPNWFVLVLSPVVLSPLWLLIRTQRSTFVKKIWKRYKVMKVLRKRTPRLILVPWLTNLKVKLHLRQAPSWERRVLPQVPECNLLGASYSHVILSSFWKTLNRGIACWALFSNIKAQNRVGKSCSPCTWRHAVFLLVRSPERIQAKYQSSEISGAATRLQCQEGKTTRWATLFGFLFLGRQFLRVCVQQISECMCQLWNEAESRSNFRISLQKRNTSLGSWWWCFSWLPVWYWCFSWLTCIANWRHIPQPVYNGSPTCITIPWGWSICTTTTPHPRKTARRFYFSLFVEILSVIITFVFTWGR